MRIELGKYPNPTTTISWDGLSPGGWRLAAQAVFKYLKYGPRPTVTVDEYNKLLVRSVKLDEERAIYKEALEQIIRKGTVFDAKGTHSTKVYNIARSALERGK